VIGSESRQILRRREWKVHARFENIPVFDGAIHEEALRMTDVVRDRLPVFRNEDVRRMAGKALADAGQTRTESRAAVGGR
jgi:hypothetical protein